MNTDDLKSFHYLENGEIDFSLFDTVRTEKRLDEGSYRLNAVQAPNGAWKIKLSVNEDKETVKIHDFPQKEKIDNLVDSFFKPEVFKKIHDLGLYHKLGFLFYGREGTGKTTTMKYYASKAVEASNALVLYMDCYVNQLSMCWNFVRSVRKIQDNPIVIVFDEFEHMATCNESLIKSIFDGNQSIDNCMFLASTNYIDKVPNAIKDRPSRFKYQINIEEINDVDYITLLVENMLGDTLNKKDIKAMAKSFKGKTLDTIKQSCIDRIMDIETYETKEKKIGFNS